MALHFSTKAGTLTSLQFRDTVSTIQGTTNASHIFSLDLVADFAAENDPDLRKMLDAQLSSTPKIMSLVVQPKLMRAMRKNMKQAGEKQSVLVEALMNLEMLKAHNAEGYLQRRWEQSNLAAADSYRKIRSLSNACSATPMARRSGATSSNPPRWKPAPIWPAWRWMTRCCNCRKAMVPTWKAGAGAMRTKPPMTTR